MTFFNQEE